MLAEEEDIIALFRWPEYVVFSVVLLISSVIGLYYGCFSRNKQNTTSEFLMAGRKMSPFPMSMSLVASFLSGILLLGTPAEIYLKGSSYWMVVVPMFFVILTTSYLYLPVFFNLQLTSVYEYLEKRFHGHVRRLASLIVSLQLIIYMSIVAYAPSLALTQVTGMNAYAIVGLTFLVCVFYTSLGGMKAVIWTDTFQFFIMFGSIFAVIIKGVSDLGGIAYVWETARTHSRLQFINWDIDPRVRHSIWALVIGSYFNAMSIYAVNQAQVQRCLTVPSMRQARMALWINFVASQILVTICCFAGLVMFAKYHSCDPFTTKRVSSADQIIVLFVMEVFDELPGLPGFFVGGVFAGCLSTVSTCLNSLSAICLEDFIKKRYQNLSEKKATQISKSLPVLFGIISFGIVFLVSQLDGVLQMTVSAFGAIGGPLLGVFTLGMFFPWANWKGAFIGTLSSLLFMIWICVGTSVEINKGNLVHKNLDLSVEGCANQNFTTSPPKVGTSGGIIEFYRLSYLWYSMFGCAWTVFIGLLISFMTGAQDARKLNPNMISPAINKLICWLFPNFRHKIGWDLGADLELTTSKKI